ncbi:FK506-binding protein 1, variant 2 [Coprinopsis cinerea AmutBmut pab1-1]|nr:FK506-binding protein 1, variant 2 [Coprinopsis cinerea AmutBmut pab1-1]
MKVRFWCFDAACPSGRVDDLERGAVLIIDAIIDLGVPQLSLGQKAVLTASPDYVGTHQRAPKLCAHRSRRCTGLWQPRLPSCDTSQLDTQIRG